VYSGTNTRTARAVAVIRIPEFAKIENMYESGILSPPGNILPTNSSTLDILISHFTSLLTYFISTNDIAKIRTARATLGNKLIVSRNIKLISAKSSSRKGKFYAPTINPAILYIKYKNVRRNANAKTSTVNLIIFFDVSTVNV